MLTSISPLGERARHNRWTLTAGSYMAGSVAAAAAVGAALGGAGFGLRALAGPSLQALAAAAALICAGGAVADMMGPPVLDRLPMLRRQVDEDWLHRYRGWVYGAGFGAQLGSGGATIVTTAAVYVTFALEVLAGSAAAGALIGAAFGLARSLPLLSVAGIDSAVALRDRHRRLVAYAGPARLITVAVLVAASAACLGGALT